MIAVKAKQATGIYRESTEKFNETWYRLCKAKPDCRLYFG